MVRLVRQGTWERWANRDQLVLKVLRVRRGRKANKGSRECRAPLDRRDLKECRAPLDRRDLKVLPAR
jgi:hypothetical protein